MNHATRRVITLIAIAAATAALLGLLTGRWITGALISFISFTLAALISTALFARTPDAPGDRGSTASSDHASSTHVPDTLLDSLGDPALIINPQGVILRANLMAERFIGAGPLQSRRVSEVFTRADLAAAYDSPPRRWTARMRMGGVERWVEATIGRAGRDTLLTLRDATEAAEASRIRTDFVANASHELRTPIAAIRAGLETLEAGSIRDEQVAARLLKMLTGQVERLESLVRDLLDLARVESADLPVRVEPLRTAELEESLRSEFAPVCAERRLNLRFDWGPGVDGAATDPRLHALALRNLVENATKYAYDNTDVDVVARVNDSRLRIEVRDRGVGIPLAHQQRVFERFYQVDPARSGGAKRGTGLGLAIVRHAIRALGGSVGLSSVWKEGATVWIESPIPPTPPQGERSP
ncbi:MAG: sensor histidine kinase [Phycisphaerales bacterium]